MDLAEMNITGESLWDRNIRKNLRALKFQERREKVEWDPLNKREEKVHSDKVKIQLKNNAKRGINYEVAFSEQKRGKKNIVAK